MGDKTAAKLRWKIAGLLNRLPGQCWANLVQWALDGPAASRRMGYPPWPRRIDSVCRRDAEQNGACYCGNLDGTAKCKLCGAPGDRATLIDAVRGGLQCADPDACESRSRAIAGQETR
jgi:hypothetical protein